MPGARDAAAAPQVRNALAAVKDRISELAQRAPRPAREPSEGGAGSVDLDGAGEDWKRAFMEGWNRVRPSPARPSACALQPGRWPMRVPQSATWIRPVVAAVGRWRGQLEARVGVSRRSPHRNLSRRGPRRGYRP